MASARSEPKTGQFAVAGNVMNFSFDSTGHSASDMGWEQVNFSFTATASTTTASFVSGISGDFGPVVTDLIVDPPLAPTITTDPNITEYQTSAAGTPTAFPTPTATDPNGGTVSVACNPGVGFGLPGWFEHGDLHGHGE